VRGKVAFKEADLTRAIKATIKAGLSVAAVEIDVATGIITVHADKPVQEKKESDTSNPWDEVLDHEDK
jgi:hypothetical protein